MSVAGERVGVGVKVRVPMCEEAEYRMHERLGLLCGSRSPVVGEWRIALSEVLRWQKDAGVQESRLVEVPVGLLDVEVE